MNAALAGEDEDSSEEDNNRNTRRAKADGGTGRQSRLGWIVSRTHGGSRIETRHGNRRLNFTRHASF
jgi:hypothetical protein